MKQLILTNETFKQKLQGFKERLMVQGASNTQVYVKPNTVKEFLHHLERQEIEDLKDVTQTTIDGYFDYLKKRPSKNGGGLSAASINKHAECVLRFMEYLNDATIGQSGFKVKYLRSKPKPKDILLEEEIENLFDAAGYTPKGITDKAILSLLYGCGLRRKELLDLEVQDIDLNKGLIHLDQTKTKYDRDVPMSPNVQQHLEDYLFNVRQLLLDDTSQETSVILSQTGRKMSDVNLPKRMKSLAEKTNIQKNVTIHGFRHAIATHLHRHLDIEEVALFLGHKNLDSTMIYTHLKNEIYGND